MICAKRTSNHYLLDQQSQARVGLLEKVEAFLTFLSSLSLCLQCHYRKASETRPQIRERQNTENCEAVVQRWGGHQYMPLIPTDASTVLIFHLLPMAAKPRTRRTGAAPNRDHEPSSSRSRRRPSHFFKIILPSSMHHMKLVKYITISVYFLLSSLNLLFGCRETEGKGWG